MNANFVVKLRPILFVVKKIEKLLYHRILIARSLKECIVILIVLYAQMLNVLENNYV